jgi:hypothetical protein
VTEPKQDPAEEFAGAPVPDPWDEPSEPEATTADYEPQPEEDNG